MLDAAELLAPLEDANPCGPPLDDHPDFEAFRSLYRSPQRPPWARLQTQAVALAQASRDLRAWIWFTRASLCTDGLPGLASGLELIADGLQRYWDVLPPVDVTETRPGERFFKRLTALGDLGVTSSACKLEDLTQGGRTIVDLRADLDGAMAKAAKDAGGADAVARAQTAAAAITQLFKERFGEGNDPQLGFEVVLDKLATLRPMEKTGPEKKDPDRPPGPGSDVPNSREDVIRMLDLLLGYYVRHEPSSPVPLILERAKRLVRLTFSQAMKELAPSGLKELQAATGTIDEKK